MSLVRRCPALLVSAAASGQGKTTLTAALARWHRRQGRTVRVFKTGPDFIDPGILAAASGSPVYQLDAWMVGIEQSRALLYAAAETADVILVEGMMGLFDGQPSSADLAQAFGLHVLALIDAQALAETFGAIALGLQTYRPELRFAGFCANRVAGAGHAEMLRKSLPAGLSWVGYLPHRPDHSLPERHLGLLQAAELPDLDRHLQDWSEALTELSADLPVATAFQPPAVEPLPRLLAGVSIGVARDAAFSFLYQANLDLLADLGAELRFFSPLLDPVLPPVHSIYLPGGYPELHLPALSRNTEMQAALRAHVAADKPVLAECGGFMYLLDELIDMQGVAGRLCGILAGRTTVHASLAAIGYQSASFPEGTLRGHTFHHSRLQTSMTPTCHANTVSGHPGEAVYQQGRITAGYLHFYFPSNPVVVAALLKP